jgi:chromosome segregation protein
VLSAIYIKGFKTFARPVRMPIEGGVTAIVGPNGSGKSNITDAVLFALGEQSAGMLRAGSMGDLIFSGSDSLPAANVAEVTLVIDNSSGEVSLPYGEVSLSRRISRDGGTEYRINGTRARMANVRFAAGEVGLGRHSILRQGAVDAIVSGGAEACRQALEEAAGLGVYRRRRVSASRRLEKADAQLEQSRRIEAELSDQLRRIEREAVAAREYREVEARFRELSLAHLFRVANREVDGKRKELEEAQNEVGEISAREERLRGEEKALERNLADSERELRMLEGTVERLEEGVENLRGESLRADRSQFRLEAGRGNDEERRNSLARLEAESRRVGEGLETLRARHAKVEEGYSSAVGARDEKQRASRLARERSGEAERNRSRLAAEMEGISTRLNALESDGAEADGEAMPVPPEMLARLEEFAGSLEGDPSSEAREMAESLLSRVGEHRRSVGILEAEANRRRGALSAVVGRVESRVRSLREAAPGHGSGVRLFEVVRARPGFENAVEAALGEFGAGVLARDVGEGVRMLSETQRIAIRLDAEAAAEDHGGLPGTPLLDCVDIVDERFSDSVKRLLGGIYVVDDAESNHLTNGHVAVTKEGIRLTRTSVSLVASGGFAREARLAAGMELLEELEAGPGEKLRNIHAELSRLSGRLEAANNGGRSLASLVRRTRRVRETLTGESRRRLASAEKKREASSERAEAIARLKRERSEKEAALAESVAAMKTSQRELSSAAAANDAAHSAAEEAGRERKRLRAAISEGEKRANAIEARLEKARASAATDTDEAPRLAARIRAASEKLSDVSGGRRSALRMSRAEKTEHHRRASSRQNSLARDAAEVRAEVSSARSRVERIEDSLRQAAESSTLAAEEIREEWAASLEDAEREARKHPGSTDEERNKLARKLKRFGNVNLLALSQESEMRERHETISSQRADAEDAANELGRIIRTIDEEIEVRFSQTFSRVSRTFGEMVPRMMAGASGTLDLSEEGVEIGIRLGRKGWRSLKVLSGGERSLLALSFLFSILLSRGDMAETFCILDEAEAALDDVNLARFISVVDSHRANGRFILVTHQKRTMAAADILYGAVQDASGATSVVSKRIQGD